MAITYVLVKRGVPNDSLAPKRWYAASSSLKVASYEKICEEVTYSSSATKGDVTLAIEGCIAAMVRHLSEGDIIELGQFGRFHMTVTNTGQIMNPDGSMTPAAPLNKEDFKAAKNISGCKIVFTPGPALRNMMLTAKYTMIEGGTVEEVTTNEEVSNK